MECLDSGSYDEILVFVIDLPLAIYHRGDKLAKVGESISPPSEWVLLMSSVFHTTHRCQLGSVCLGAFVLIAALLLVGCDDSRGEAHRIYEEGRRVLVMHSDVDKAESLFLKALEVDPTSTQAHYELALLYYGIYHGAYYGDYYGRWKSVIGNLSLKNKAVHHIREIFRLSPDHIFAHYQLGIIAIEGGDLDLALREFETTHRLSKGPFGWEPDRSSYQLFIYKGFLLSQRGDVHRAEAILGRAQALNPSGYHDFLSKLQIDLASLYEAQGKHDKAVSELKRALAIWEKTLGPDHPYVANSLNNLAGLYFNQGKYAKAEPLYTRALSIMEKTAPNHPDVANLLDNLAELYVKTGRDKEAIPLLNRVRKIRLGL